MDNKIFETNDYYVERNDFGVYVIYANFSVYKGREVIKVISKKQAIKNCKYLQKYKEE